MKKSNRLSFRKKSKKRHKVVQAIIYVSGDSLRVIEDKAGITTDEGQVITPTNTTQRCILHILQQLQPYHKLAVYAIHPKPTSLPKLACCSAVVYTFIPICVVPSNLQYSFVKFSLPSVNECSGQLLKRQ